VPLKDRSIEVLVDRYYPNATMDEQLIDGGEAENPAIRVMVRHGEQQGEVWLVARDPERFGLRVGEAHVLFLEPSTDQQLAELLTGEPLPPEHARGVVSIRLPGGERPHEIPVPQQLNRPIPLDGTSYVVTFKDYFPDFAITQQGPIHRSNQPNNPAVALTLSGPEGTDAHLLFALHPEFQALHGITHVIPSQLHYTHLSRIPLPPQAMTFIRTPSGTLSAVLTGSGGQRQLIEPVALRTRYPHPWLGYQFEVAAWYSRAKVVQQFSNRDDEVRSEALHVVGRDGDRTAEAWLTLGSEAELPLGNEPVRVAYRSGERALPFAIKLLDFRKVDYPGTQMAAGFESDVELTDPQRGIILMRKISMNNPLRYRGFSVYQSSYIPGPTETTVLSVRSDPGTPCVYAGFLIVIVGIASMFLLRRGDGSGSSEPANPPLHVNATAATRT
jgi:hypothetical protein